MFFIYIDLQVGESHTFLSPLPPPYAAPIPRGQRAASRPPMPVCGYVCIVPHFAGHREMAFRVTMCCGQRRRELGGRGGEGEFRPNEWKPGMCVGEGGKGGESRQVPLPLCTWAHVWGPKKRREIVRRSDPLLWRLFFFLLLLAVGCSFLVAAYLQGEEWK